MAKNDTQGWYLFSTCIHTEGERGTERDREGGANRQTDRQRDKIIRLKPVMMAHAHDPRV